MTSRRDDLNRLAADAVDAAGIGCMDVETLVLAGSMLDVAASMRLSPRKSGSCGKPWRTPSRCGARTKTMGRLYHLPARGRRTVRVEVPLRQTKRMALVEAVVNVAVGMGLSLAVQVVMFTAMGVPLSLGQNGVVVLAMTALSLGRSYCLRIFFGWWRRWWRAT